MKKLLFTLAALAGITAWGDTAFDPDYVQEWTAGHSLNLEDSATYKFSEAFSDTGYMYVLKKSGTSAVTFLADDDDSGLKTTRAYVGASNSSSKGNGVWTINGGTYETSNLNVGDTAGYTGTITIKKGTLKATTDAIFGAGENGNAVLNMEGGTFDYTPTGRDMLFANKTGSTATVNLAGGTIKAGRHIYVGNADGADAKMTVTGGAVETPNGTLRIGAVEGATGTLELVGEQPGINLDKVLFGVKQGTGILMLNDYPTEVTKLPKNFPNDSNSTAILALTNGSSFALGKDMFNSTKYTLGAWAENGGSIRGTDQIRLNGVVKAMKGGTVTFPNYLYIGNVANGVGDLEAIGGTITQSNKELQLGAGTSAKATVVVADEGTLTAPKTVLMLGNESETKVTVRDGGTLVFPGFSISDSIGSGTAAVAFDGGTVETTGSGADVFPACEQVSYTIGSKGLTMKTTKGVNLSGKLAGEGGLTLVGPYSLTINTQPSYTGVTEIKASELKLAEGITLEGGIKENGGKVVYTGDVFPGPCVVASGTVLASATKYRTYGYVLEEGAKLSVDASDCAVGASVNVGKVTLPEGAVADDYVTVTLPTGIRAASSAAIVDGELVVTIKRAEGAVTTTWIGGSNGSWTNAACWSCGVPMATDTVVVNSKATITLDTEYTHEIDFAELQLSNTLTINNPDSYYNPIVIKVGAVNGTGLFRMERTDLTPMDTGLTIAEGVTVQFLYNRNNRPNAIKGTKEAPVVINGSVVADGYLNLAWTTVKGSLTSNVEGASSGYSCQTMDHCVIGSLVGSMIYNTNVAEFTGDNSGFTGMLRMRGKNTLSGDSSAMNAATNLTFTYASSVMVVNANVTGFTGANLHAVEGYKITSTVDEKTGATTWSQVEDQGIDPTDPKPQTVKGGDETEALKNMSITMSAAVKATGVTEDVYKGYFKYAFVDNGDGTFTITMTGIADEVTADVSETITEDFTSVTVPAGLYYKVTTGTAVKAISTEAAKGLSDGTAIAIEKVGDAQGFVKVQIGAAEIK